MSIGNNIRQLRLNRGITQEQLAEQLYISGQAVSKWENQTALPDISCLPLLADFFGVSIDELMDYKLNALTNKERFIKFMAGNGILEFGDCTLKSGARASYYINTEKFVTNAQIAKIGEYFADCIRENNIDFDAIMGLAYHGISFSAATAYALFQKYGVTVNYCHDRKVKDSRGRSLCGYTLKDGDRVVVIDDVMSSGQTICQRVDEISKTAAIEVAAVIVIADRMLRGNSSEKAGFELTKEKYGAKVYSIITDEDIKKYLQ
ncbi:MAG: orotate phosphoribosyltransferase [Blautia sp.]|nr:orotate phosphoribosyltransferase [Blautia sp.]